MFNDHPFKDIPTHILLGIFIVLMGMTFILGCYMRTFHQALGEKSIVSFEFSWTIEAASEIMEYWGTAVEVARVSVLVDFFFLLVYSTTLSTGCLWVFSKLKSRPLFSRFGIQISWLQWVAGMLDAGENFALLQLLDGATLDLWAKLAAILAGGKFLLISIGLFYILSGFIIVLASKKNNGTRTFQAT